MPNRDASPPLGERAGNPAVPAPGAPPPGDAPSRRTRGSDRPLRLGRWRLVLRETGIVVAGILIAFALDAWWDARGERVQNEARLVALSEDFRASLDRLDSALARHTHIHGRTRALVEALRGSPPGAEVAVPDSLLSALFEWRTQDWSTGAVEAVLASGGLRGLGSLTLRARLAAWPARVDDIYEDQVLARDFINSVVIPAMAEQGDVAHLVEPWSGKRFSGATTIRATGTVRTLAAARAAQQELIARSLQSFRRDVEEILEALTSAGPHSPPVSADGHR